MRTLTILVLLIAGLSACSMKRSNVEHGESACVACPQESRGRDGDDGRDGVAGRDGTPGRDGLRGSAGQPGRDGPVGGDGATGPMGVQGERGPAGDRGPPGEAEKKTFADMAINAGSVLVALLALVVSIFAYKAEQLAAQRAVALEKATHETELRGRRSEAITLSTIIQGRAGALAYKYLKLRDRLQSIPDSGSPDEQDLRSRIDRRAIDHQAHYDGATNVLAELFDDSKMAGKDLAYFDKLIAKNRGASASLDNPVYDEMVVDSEKEIVALEASNP